MKLALVNGERTEAIKGAKGLCPNCGSEVIARCGEERVDHWAHKGIRNCDTWWENETEWHRAWKGKFPTEWQEVIHTDEESGEKHIADVKTDSGWVLEFQHSYLKPEERRSRNAFYNPLVWVVDGTRRKTDNPQFEKIRKEGYFEVNNPPLAIWQLRNIEECRLFNEWHDGDALVFFDFQDIKETKQEMLWFLFPKLSNAKAYISEFPRDLFIKLLNENEFDDFVENKIKPCHEELARTTNKPRKLLRWSPKLGDWVEMN